MGGKGPDFPKKIETPKIEKEKTWKEVGQKLLRLKGDLELILTFLKSEEVMNAHREWLAAKNNWNRVKTTLKESTPRKQMTLIDFPINHEAVDHQSRYYSSVESYKGC